MSPTASRPTTVPTAVPTAAPTSAPTAVPTDRTWHRTFPAPTGAETMGTLTLIARDGALVACWMDAQQHLPEPARFGRAESAETDDATAAVLDAAQTQLEEYFAGRRRRFDLPLDPVGTDFQRAVWLLLRDIEFGRTTTYGRLAAALDRPSASRAVGAAVGRNPLGVIVPCHRVIGGSGALTGYAGGIQRKTWLLQHEGVLEPALL
jgi:methylated-DNA-[protein]-cysteine S-methyltransferase